MLKQARLPLRLLRPRPCRDRGEPLGPQKNINLQILSVLPVPTIERPEQHRIVAYLDNLQERVDGLRVLQNETFAELKALMPSILDKAFRGDL